MTNKEKYKKAFSTLHACNEIFLEEETMKRRKHTLMKKVVAASAAIVVACGGMTAAYAADLGGIRETLTMWFHGEETEVTATKVGENSYRYTFTDSEGNPQELNGGGVVIDDDGSERPATAQEVLDDFSDEVVYTDDGEVKLVSYDLKKELNITDMFDKDGICKVAIKDGKKKIYFTIENEGDECISFEKTQEEPKNAQEYTIIE